MKNTKHNTKKQKKQDKTMHDEIKNIDNDLFERCIEKGLIQKTPYGYYFKPEFFETLNIYE